jgi:hypothetical protein
MFFSQKNKKKAASSDQKILSTPNIQIKMEYTESDLLWRLIEPLYDVSWAYHMSSTVDNVAKRIERRRKTFSSTASVVSTATTATLASTPSLSGLSVADKVVAMETMLHRVSRVMRARQFEDICQVSLKSSDDLYPGFRDVLFIAQFLLERGSAYQGQLSCDEINGITLTQVFQNIFYEFCAFLLSENRVGKEAIKLIITPTKITHAAYDLCRQKFARLLADQTGIVQDGLLRIIRRIQKDREVPDLPRDDEPLVKTPDVDAVEALVVDEPEVPEVPVVVIKKEEGGLVVEPEVVIKTEEEAASQGSDAPQTLSLPAHDIDTLPPAKTPSPPLRKASPKAPLRPLPRRRQSTTASVVSRVSFPVIELSSSDSDESSDEDSVSSLDSGI